MQFGELAVQLVVGGLVHRRKRFVEQQHLGLARQGTGERDALLLAAGKLARSPRGPGQPQACEQLGGVCPGLRSARGQRDVASALK